MRRQPAEQRIERVEHHVLGHASTPGAGQRRLPRPSAARSISSEPGMELERNLRPPTSKKVSAMMANRATPEAHAAGSFKGSLFQVGHGPRRWMSWQDVERAGTRAARGGRPVGGGIARAMPHAPSLSLLLRAWRSRRGNSPSTPAAFFMPLPSAAAQSRSSLLKAERSLPRRHQRLAWPWDGHDPVLLHVLGGDRVDAVPAAAEDARGGPRRRWRPRPSSRRR
jgi:hypothetical protein